MAELFHIIAETKRPGLCRSCGAPITWAELEKSQRAHPFSGPLEVVDQQLSLFDARVVETVFATSHFADCPFAAEHRPT